MAIRKPIVEVQVPVEELKVGDPIFFNLDKQVLLRRTPLPAGGYLLIFQGRPLVRMAPPGSYHTVALVRA